MAAKYILAVFSVVFFIAAIVRLARDKGRLAPASKTWLLVGFIFAAVSIWLFWQLGG
jgi:hypothetical protein